MESTLSSRGAAVHTEARGLLERLTREPSPLTALYDTLDRVSTELGVDRAMCVVEDVQLGRQVFVSRREPLGDRVDVLSRPPGLFTEPPALVAPEATALLVAAIGLALRLALAAVDTAARDDLRPISAGDQLTSCTARAVARHQRYGWGFTLVLAALTTATTHRASELVAALRRHVRDSDELLTLGSGELALLLPATNPDLVPLLLHRVARDAEVGSLTFGLATCPGDAVDTDALINHARRRRADAARAHEEQDAN